MSDKFSPKDAKDDDLDDMFGENPGYPSRKRPSDFRAPGRLEPPPSVEPPKESSG